MAATMLFSGCATWHAGRADKAHDRMAYAKAADQYDKALRSADDPAKAAHLRGEMLRAAEAHQRKHGMKEAATLYGRAERLGTLSAEQAFNYGEALLALGHRENAAMQFMNVLAARPEHRAAQDLLLSCETYHLFYTDTARYAVSELPFDGVSGAFGATPYQDGVVIAGEQPVGLGRENPWNGRSFLDLYFVKKHTAVTWDEARPLAGEVNGPFHEGPAVFSADGRTMYFTRSNYYKFKLQKDGRDVSHLKLFRATLDDNGRWGDLHEFAYNGEDFSTGHAALSADGGTLFFASDRPGGLGGTDIWRCINNGAGWQAPENLGPRINTPGDELFPTTVGDAFYFSSTAHQNMGGLDVFVTNWTGREWAEPRNMGYPINTPFDDLGFLMNADGKSGYFSSDRSGVDRIYQFFVQEPIFYVEGTVIGDSLPPYLPHAVVTLTNIATGEDTSMTTTANGHFRFNMKPNVQYRLEVAKKDMLTQSRDLSTAGATASHILREDFHLQSIELDKPMPLPNIYFDYGDWDIRLDMLTELDKLARLLKDNPNLTFELGSHTDCRGSAEYNLVLSDARASRVVDYLIRAGVEPERLASHGYGESRPVNHCTDGVSCTEEEHQDNRRTEFKVVQVRELASTPR